LARTLGSLGDFFPDKDIRCRIRGCNSLWRFSGEDALHNVAEGKSSRPERMCDTCFAKFRQMSDQQVLCSRPGCENTWTWNRFQQLEAGTRGSKVPPNGLCQACRSEVDKTADKEIQCRIRGCTKTWTWGAREQLLSEDPNPQRRLCGTCFSQLKQLQDRQVECRTKGCSKTWAWNRYQQLEYIASGKELAFPPKRMCQDCYDLYNSLENRELPCKIRECNRTWTYSVHQQLEQRVAAGEDAEEHDPPSRMCRECYHFFLQSVDRQVICRNRGCEKTWTYARSMQLYDWLKKRRTPPVLMCTDCRQRLKELQDREMPCMVSGCTRSWLYEASDQLKNELLHKGDPSPRRCKECEAFLVSHPPLVLACEHCSAEMRWSSYEQLLCEQGTFVKPSKCPDCAKQDLALGTPGKPKKRKHHHVVKIPATGKWHEDNRIHDWPPHMTYESIERMEKADVRVVVIGDDLTFSDEQTAAAWPARLEVKLNDGLPRKKVAAVVNAGIAKSTAYQGALRFARDVRPFDPQIVIFSFAFADALIRGIKGEGQPRYNIEPAAAEEGLRLFLRELKSIGGKPLYWTANPVFPEDIGEVDARADWLRSQRVSTDHILRSYRQACKQEDIPILDLRSRFEVNGTRSARKWMTNWYLHNDVGANNIATWSAAHLLHKNFLPV